MIKWSDPRILIRTDKLRIRNIGVSNSLKPALDIGSVRNTSVMDLICIDFGRLGPDPGGKDDPQKESFAFYQKKLRFFTCNMLLFLVV